MMTVWRISIDMAYDNAYGFARVLTSQVYKYSILAAIDNIFVSLAVQGKFSSPKATLQCLVLAKTKALL